MLIGPVTGEKLLASKPAKLSSTPRTHGGREEPIPERCPLTFTRCGTQVSILTCMYHVYKHNNNKQTKSTYWAPTTYHIACLVLMFQPWTTDKFPADIELVSWYKPLCSTGHPDSEMVHHLVQAHMATLLALKPVSAQLSSLILWILTRPHGGSFTKAWNLMTLSWWCLDSVMCPPNDTEPKNEAILDADSISMVH